MKIKVQSKEEIQQEALNLASIPEVDFVLDYKEDITEEEFKERYAGMYQKDNGKRLSKRSLQKIWNKFIREERVDFFTSHNTFSLADVFQIGYDKFIYTLGWTKPSHVSRWRNNKVRIGPCCHCNDQFIPLIFQFNQGLCNNCKPKYSIKAIRNYMVTQLNGSKRYYKAKEDLLMDFYIVFYNDKKLRELFLVDSPFAKEYDAMDPEIPEWAKDRRLGGNEDGTEEAGNSKADDSGLLQIT
jgi:hypothetical protein